MRAISLLVPLQRYEGYGVTPLKAMVSRVPFVASDTGHFREFSGDGAAGLVVDPKVAAQEIKGLLQSPNRLEAMSHPAVARAWSYYAIENEASIISAVYERLLADAWLNLQTEAHVD